MIDLIESVELKDWRRVDGHEIPVLLGSGEAPVLPIGAARAPTGFPGWTTLHHLKQHQPSFPRFPRNECYDPSPLRSIARAARPGEAQASRCMRRQT